MSRARCIAWPDLTPEVQAEVRNAYVHWHHDTTSATFDIWAAKHAFYVTRKGRLAMVPKHCEPIYLADGTV